ncbi:MAG: deaminase [bacterium]
MEKETIIIAHIPVLHQGYKKLFESHPEAKELYILGPELVGEYPHLAKDIRQLDAELVKEAIESWKIFDVVEILDKELLVKIADLRPRIVLPNEEVTKGLVEKYLSKIEVLYSSIFLRWDKHNTVTETEINPDRKISREEFDRNIMEMAGKEGEKSTDIWRRIGSILVKDGNIICSAHNIGTPTEQTSMYEGDPRNNFHKGVHLELSTFLHSEAGVVAEMARRGIAVEGADIYVTTYPCAPCAKMIAYSGIKRVFYKNGYGVLDSERILKDKGVEIIRVE